MYKKTACQNQKKFISDDCFQMYKNYNYLQAYLQQTQTFLQASKLLKTHVNIFTQTHKLFKNAQRIKPWG